MENVKKEELNKLIGINKTNIFYDMVDVISSSYVLETYDNAQTFHDGKWVMFNIIDNSIIEDLKKLLFIKRKPNKK